MAEVFVYGSLIGVEDTVEPAQLEGFEIDRSAAYPTIVPAHGAVAGELITVSPERLRELDAQEGCDPEHPDASLYWRKQVDGVWVYIGNPETAETRWENGAWTTSYTEDAVDAALQDARIIRQ